MMSSEESFNSRTPCGVRHIQWRIDHWGWEFQFTHPVWGATTSHTTVASLSESFNSRTPCGVRQIVRKAEEERADVSIHAPRVGCDSAWTDADE